MKVHVSLDLAEGFTCSVAAEPADFRSKSDDSEENLKLASLDVLACWLASPTVALPKLDDSKLM
jgi:hypothetical protein